MLADMTRRVGQAITTGPAAPFLGGILCEADKDKQLLRMTSTDTQSTVQIRRPVQVERPGRILVDGKFFKEVFTKMTDGPVTVTADSSVVKVLGGGAELSVRLTDPEDYPTQQTITFNPDTPHIAPDELDHALKQVLPAVSASTENAALGGVFFDPQNTNRGHPQVNIVATDKYRMAVKELTGLKFKEPTLLPAAQLRKLGKILVGAVHKVRVAYSQNGDWIAFGTEDCSVAIRALGLTFPNYQHLLDNTSFDHAVELDKTTLTQALDRAGLVADNHAPIQLHVNPQHVTVTVDRSDYGQTVEKVDTTKSDYTDQVKVAFNQKYLREGLNVIPTSHVSIRTSGETTATLFEPTDRSGYQYLIMPVKL